MYLLLLGQAASFMHCCDTVLFQRFMHLKACNGYGLNATYQNNTFYVLASMYFFDKLKSIQVHFLAKPEIDVC